MDEEALVMLSDILPTGFECGVLNGKIKPGDIVAIVGSGGLWRFFPYGDPKKNKAVYDKTGKYVTGRWIDADTLKPGEIHPSIENISVEDAKKEVDSVIDYIS